MNRTILRRKLGLAFFCIAFSALFSVSGADAPTDVPLWKSGQGGANAEKATLRWFVPEKPNGTIVVICPGGGYGMLVKSNEGYDIAQWLNKLNVTGVVLSYRIAPNRHPLPLQDAARAVRTVREEAKTHGVEPKKVGVMGFSAGGHLASTIATHFDNGDPNAADPVEKQSSRPDFQVLLYPVITMDAKTESGTKRNLLGNSPSKELIDLLSNEKQVTDNTPEAFVCHSAKDQLVSVDNSRMYVEALKQHKVPVEYLEFAEGGHGFSGSSLPLWQMWQKACEEWMVKSGIIAGGSAAAADGDYPGTDLEPNGNPIFTDAWTADPAPLVVGDRIFVYTGEDIYRDGEQNGLPGNYNIADWRCYSSSDLVHWRSHGILLKPEDFPNGLKGTAWASQVVEKNGKFYWYCTFRDTKNGGNSIGVAIADSPVGPFKPVEKPVVVDELTSGRAGWNDIDPTVLIDDDGTAWLSWGHTNNYVAKLKDNMVELDGEITDTGLQSYIEGPWLYKRNGLYYNIYPGMGRGGECINYSTAKDLRGPWTFRGQVTGAAKNSFTIHPGVVDFKGRTFLFYHNGTLDRDGQKGQGLRRSVCVDELFFNEDGTIREVTQTKEGIKEPVR
jgi:acetyl esterase/lipase